MTVFDQDYCNDRYDITGKSPHAQSRQTFLPKMFSKATFCAGNVVRSFTKFSNLHITALF